MIADGVLENPHVDAMIAQHVWTSLETGTIGLRNGAMFGASDRFFLTVKGQSAPGSAPEDGIDAIVIAANVINSLHNILANSVTMEGTCRNVTPKTRECMAERIEKVVEDVTKALGGDYEFQYCRGYSPTINHPDMVQLVYDGGFHMDERCMPVGIEVMLRSALRYLGAL